MTRGYYLCGYYLLSLTPATAREMITAINWHTLAVHSPGAYGQRCEVCAVRDCPRSTAAVQALRAAGWVS